MLVVDKKSHKTPLITDTGEMITELIGRAITPKLDPQHSLAKVVLPPGKSSSKHYHEVSEETYYILAGEARMYVNGENFNLVPGDV